MHNIRLTCITILLCVLYPSCRHTTAASVVPASSSEIVPQTPDKNISTRPSHKYWPPTKRMSPSFISSPIPCTACNIASLSVGTEFTAVSYFSREKSELHTYMHALTLLTLDTNVLLVTCDNSVIEVVTICYVCFWTDTCHTVDLYWSTPFSKHITAGYLHTFMYAYMNAP